MKKAILFLAIFNALNTLSIAQSYSKLLKSKPGIVSYTFRKAFATDMPGTLDYIKSLGIDDIEFSNLFNQNPNDIRTMIDRRGIRCTSFGVSYDDLMKNRPAVMANAKILGASYVRLAWVPHDKPWDLATAKQTAAIFNEIGKDIKANGLTFVYHNHGYEFEPYEKGTLYDVLMKETNPDYVSYELDILWAKFPGQDPAALIKKYPERYKLMHVKDLKKGIVGDLSGKTPTENDVTLGTGQMDLKKILKAAKRSSIEHFYIEDENDNSWNQVPLSLAYLKSL
ncbi:MAG: sugar phosphate isomerase/epimerase [Saprospiraceae bacterium]